MPRAFQKALMGISRTEVTTTVQQIISNQIGDVSGINVLSSGINVLSSGINVLSSGFNNDVRIITDNLRNLQSTSPSPTIVDGINANTRLILNNSELISQNSAQILTNSVRVESLEQKVNDFGAQLTSQSQQIKDQVAGTAAILSLPDVYLNSDDAAALSGGVGIYGGEVGFGSTFAIRGNDQWSFGASVGVSGEQYTGKVQARYAFKKK